MTLILIRHGETEWSRTGRHTGRTDVALTARGEQQARAAGVVIRRLIGDADPALVISSPRRRALDTAELAGFSPRQVSDSAAEWDYGRLEGLTTQQIQQDQPGWTIWSGAVPGGETAEQVSARVDRLLAEVRSTPGQAESPVLVFSHGHASRCIAARWLDRPVTDGRHYQLGTGAVSSLGFERDVPAILHWNIDNSVFPVSG